MFSLSTPPFSITPSTSSGEVQNDTLPRAPFFSENKSGDKPGDMAEDKPVVYALPSYPLLEGFDSEEPASSTTPSSSSEKTSESIYDSPQYILFNALVLEGLLGVDGFTKDTSFTFPKLTPAEAQILTEKLNYPAPNSVQYLTPLSLLHALTHQKPSKFSIKKIELHGSFVYHFLSHLFPDYMRRCFAALGKEGFYEKNRDLIHSAFPHISSNSKNVNIEISVQNSSTSLSTKKELSLYVSQVLTAILGQPMLRCKNHIHTGIKHSLTVSFGEFNFCFVEVSPRDCYASTDSLRFPLNSLIEEGRHANITPTTGQQNWGAQALFDTLLGHIHLKEIETLDRFSLFFLYSQMLRGKSSAEFNCESKIYHQFFYQKEAFYIQDCKKWMSLKENENSLTSSLFLMNIFMRPCRPDASLFLPLIDSLQKSSFISPIAELMVKEKIPIELLTSLLELLFTLVYLHKVEIPRIDLHVTEWELQPHLKVTFEEKYSLFFPLNLSSSMDRISNYSTNDQWIKYEDSLLKLAYSLLPLIPAPKNSQRALNLLKYLKSKEKLESSYLTLSSSASPLLRLLAWGFKLSFEENSHKQKELFILNVPELLDLSNNKQALLNEALALHSPKNQALSLNNELSGQMEEKHDSFTWIKLLQSIDSAYFLQTLKHYLSQGLFSKERVKATQCLLHLIQIDQQKPALTPELLLSIALNLKNLIDKVNPKRVTKAQTACLYPLALKIMETQFDLAHSLIENAETKKHIVPSSDAGKEFWLNVFIRMLDQKPPLVVLSFSKNKFPRLFKTVPHPAATKVNSLIERYQDLLTRKMILDLKYAEVKDLLEQSQYDLPFKRKTLIFLAKKYLKEGSLKESGEIFSLLLKQPPGEETSKFVEIFEHLYAALIKKKDLLQAQNLFFETNANFKLPNLKMLIYYNFFLETQLEEHILKAKNFKSVDTKILQSLFGFSIPQEISNENLKETISLISRLLTQIIEKQSTLDTATTHLANQFLPKLFLISFGRWADNSLENLLLRVLWANLKWLPEENREAGELCFWKLIKNLHKQPHKDESIPYLEYQLAKLGIEKGYYQSSKGLQSLEQMQLTLAADALSLNALQYCDYFLQKTCAITPIPAEAKSIVLSLQNSYIKQEKFEEAIEISLNYLKKDEKLFAELLENILNLLADEILEEKACLNFSFFCLNPFSLQNHKAVLSAYIHLLDFLEHVPIKFYFEFNQIITTLDHLLESGLHLEERIWKQLLSFKSLTIEQAWPLLKLAEKDSSFKKSTLRLEAWSNFLITYQLSPSPIHLKILRKEKLMEFIEQEGNSKLMFFLMKSIISYGAKNESNDLINKTNHNINLYIKKHSESKDNYIKNLRLLSASLALKSPQKKVRSKAFRDINAIINEGAHPLATWELLVRLINVLTIIEETRPKIIQEIINFIITLEFKNLQIDFPSLLKSLSKFNQVNYIISVADLFKYKYSDATNLTKNDIDFLKDLEKSLLNFYKNPIDKQNVSFTFDQLLTHVLLKDTLVKDIDTQSLIFSMMASALPLMPARSEDFFKNYKIFPKSLLYLSQKIYPLIENSLLFCNELSKTTIEPQWLINIEKFLWQEVETYRSEEDRLFYIECSIKNFNAWRECSYHMARLLIIRLANITSLNLIQRKEAALQIFFKKIIFFIDVPYKWVPEKGFNLNLNGLSQTDQNIVLHLRKLSEKFCKPDLSPTDFAAILEEQNSYEASLVESNIDCMRYIYKTLFRYFASVPLNSLLIETAKNFLGHILNPKNEKYLNKNAEFTSLLEEAYLNVYQKFMKILSSQLKGKTALEFKNSSELQYTLLLIFESLKIGIERGCFKNNFEILEAFLNNHRAFYDIIAESPDRDLAHICELSPELLLKLCTVNAFEPNK